MARFENTLTHVIVDVDDSKAHRFADGWTPLDSPTPSQADDEKAPTKRSTRRPADDEA